MIIFRTILEFRIQLLWGCTIKITDCSIYCKLVSLFISLIYFILPNFKRNSRLYQDFFLAYVSFQIQENYWKILLVRIKVLKIVFHLFFYITLMRNKFQSVFYTISFFCQFQKQLKTFYWSITKFTFIYFIYIYKLFTLYSFKMQN